jgi:hypothetical protein
LLKESDNKTNVSKKIITIDVYNTTELNLASKYNIIDLNIPELKSKIEIKVKRRKSIKTASLLYTIS